MLISILFHVISVEAATTKKPWRCEDYYTNKYCQKQAAKQAAEVMRVNAAKAAADEAAKVALMAKYPSGASLRAAVDSGQLDYDKLPKDIQKMVDDTPRPTLIPTNQIKSKDVTIPQIKTTKDKTQEFNMEIILSLFGILILTILIIKYKFKGSKHSALPPIHWQSEGGAINTISEADFRNNFRRFDWREMEYLTGYLFQKKGYSALVTQSTRDFGIDVEAKKGSEYLGIQVKHQESNVGFPDVAKTLGTDRKFTKTIIISTKSGFQSQALEHAQKNKDHIELWDKDRFKKELRDNLIK